MRTNSILHIITLLFVAGLTGYVLLKENKTKTAFVYNQKVFDLFKGTADLKSKLATKEQYYKSTLDSIKNLVQNGSADITPFYERRPKNLPLSINN